MENISRGPTFRDFVTILTEAPMQDVMVARLQSTRVQTPPLLNEMYCVRSQNIPCATPVFRIRIHRVHMFLGLMDPDPSIIKKNSKKNLDFYSFVTSF
jgi:hypothetical protein